MAIVIAALETFKMFFFSVNRPPQFGVESWVPLFYCSIFSYAFLCFAFGKGLLKEIATAALFVMVVDGVGGLVFSEAFTGFPLFNFYTFFTIIYHSAMIYFDTELYSTATLS